MKLSVEISSSQAAFLRRMAKRAGVSPEDLAQAALCDLLSGSPADFQAAAERVVDKNRELYHRLSE